MKHHRWLFAPVCLLPLVLSFRADAEDWGAYALLPVSAPSRVLEAAEEGGPVVINKSTAAASQKWIIAPAEEKSFTIRPASNPKLVLAVAQGGTKNGTPIVLEADRGRPWQRWAIEKLDTGFYRLLPQHAPGKGIDDNSGRSAPGTPMDLWEVHPKDAHLQWMIRPLAGSPVPPPEAESTYEPPALKPEDVPQGKVERIDFAESKIFPGTTRDVTVFIPAQYDGKTPACVWIKTDGYDPRMKAMMETLIAARQVPVTVGVFVKPGNLAAPMKGTGARRNRCLEYDGMGDSNARFFVDEILPFVAKKYGLNLSTRGNDRCISGGSSGGITAFNAAWERPDLFSRVYAASGSFVAFRGGHEFPTLLRKVEAQPIRAFLTTGTHDMENCAGDWYLLDLEVEKALKFSGYDYIFRTINGGHVAGAHENFMEAMAYVWKDWPKPVEAGPSAPRARDILVPQEPWKLLAEGHAGHGPACNSQGEVFFVEDNHICRIDREGHIRAFAADAGHANSLSVGPHGELYAISAVTGKLVAYDAAGNPASVADGLHGQYVLAMPNGSLYVSGNGDRPGEAGTVWLVHNGQKTQVDAGLKCATGMAYRPDQWLLCVADGHSKWVYSYQIEADGRLINKERFFWLHVADRDDDAGSEAVCYAKEGPMFVATRFGVQVCNDDGPTQVILPLPDRSRVVGVCLGGADGDTLYAFANDKIWKRKLLVHAMGAFTPWTKVMPGKL